MESNHAIADAPPAVLDSAVVVLYARIHDKTKYTGRGCTYVNGAVIDPVPCLVIANNIEDGCALLFYCDKDWRVIGAGGFSTLAEARQSAELRYSGVERLWTTFRNLTEEEVHELEETRQFLKDHPGPICD